MLWPWYALIATVALPFVGLAFSFVVDADWPLVLGLFVGLICAIVFGAMSLIVSVGRHYDRINCHAYAQQSSYQTRFVIYSTFSTDCLVKLRDGRWIPRDNLRGVSGA